MKSNIRFFIILIVCVLCCSCGHEKYLPAPPSVHSDSTIKVIYERDSIYIKDSVFVNTFVSGDTVFKEVYRDRIKDKVILSHDTIRVVSVDTLSITVPVEIPQPLNSYDSFILKVGRWLLPIILIVIILFLIIRFLK